MEALLTSVMSGHANEIQLITFPTASNPYCYAQKQS